MTEVMKWRKAPDELISFLAEITKDINCQPRKMFGYPAYFINNNMRLPKKSTSSIYKE